MQDREPRPLTKAEKASLIKDVAQGDPDVAKAARAALAQHAESIGGEASFVEIGQRDEQTGRVPVRKGKINTEGEREQDR